MDEQALAHAREQLLAAVMESEQWSGIHDTDAEDRAKDARERAVEWGVICTALAGGQPPVTNLNMVVNVANQPHVTMRPTVSRHDDGWACVYGPDRYTGVVGYGSSPADACAAFDEAWTTG